MTGYAAAEPTGGRVQLSALDVLSRAWDLYKRLFARSAVMAGVVFGVLNLFQVLLRGSGSPRLLAIVALVLSIGGTALLEGGLVEIVRGLHVDGDDDASVSEAFGRAGGELGKLVGVSVLSAIGFTIGFILFVVPGFILMTRWAVAVPVAMLEKGTARDALRRSRDIVAGNGWGIFRVILGVCAVTFVITLPFELVLQHAGALGWWAALTISSMLTAPYFAHAITVAYYMLVEPNRPIVLDRGHHWESGWDVQGATLPPVDAEPGVESVADEQQRRFDEYQQRWGQ